MISAAIGATLCFISYVTWALNGQKALAITPFQAVTSSAYSTLLGFWLNSGAPAAVPPTAQIGRLILLFVAVAAGATFLGQVLQRERRMARLGRMSGHTVVCGTGELGSSVVKRLLEKGSPTATINIEENALTRWCDELGAGVVIGDTTGPLALLDAGIERADAVFVAVGDDDRNATVAAMIDTTVTSLRESRRRRSRFDKRDSLNVIVHLSDLALYEELKPEALTISSRRQCIDLDFFSIAHFAAERITKSLVPDLGAGPQRLLVVGATPLAERLIVELATACSNIGCGGTVIRVLTPKASKFLRRVIARHPGIDELVQLEPIKSELDSHRLRSESLGLFDDANEVPERAFVALESDHETMRVALALSHAGKCLPLPQVHACIYETSGLGSIVGEDANSRPEEPAHPDQVIVHNISEHLEGIDLADLGIVTCLAKMSHEEYRRLVPNDPSAVEWDELDETLKNSNRDHARQVVKEMERLGRRLAPCDPWHSHAAFSDAEIDILAQREHQRWREEREAEDPPWTYADIPEKDPVRKLHPDLCDWTYLRTEERLKDYAVVRGSIFGLGSVGLTAVPMVTKACEPD